MEEKFGSSENNKFDKNLTFRFAKVSDINKIQTGGGLSWSYDNRKLEATTSSLLSEIIFSCDCITVDEVELEFKKERAVRLRADASKFRLGFHCEPRP